MEFFKGLTVLELCLIAQITHLEIYTETSVATSKFEIPSHPAAKFASWVEALIGGITSLVPQLFKTLKG
jgi:hypothetical protein